MEEQPRTEGNPRGELFGRRDASDWKGSAQLSQADESGADPGVQAFVQEIESDPAVAGADSPCQHLLGG